MRIRAAVCLAIVLLAVRRAAPTPTYKGHGIAMHGDLKYGPTSPTSTTSIPTRPRAASCAAAAVGTFDSFNPFIIKGNPDAGSAQIYDTLLIASADEPFSEYGLLAETIETPADRSWVTFTLRPQARWHDGKPITVDDVIWTFETLRDQGRSRSTAPTTPASPSVEKVGERGVKFTFKPGENRELPLILGQLPVLPKHYWAGARLRGDSTLEPPLGSGAYKIDQFEAGRWSTLSARRRTTGARTCR